MSNFNKNNEVSDEDFNNAIERLVKAKLVIVGTIPEHGRFTDIQLTELGKDVLMLIRALLKKCYPAFLTLGIPSYRTDKLDGMIKEKFTTFGLSSFLSSLEPPPLSEAETRAVLIFFFDRAGEKA